MSVIRIIRTNEFVNKARTISLYANGNRIGRITNGERKEFTLPAGDYTLRSKVDWCSSNKLAVTLKENEIMNVELSSFAYGQQPNGLLMLYYITFGANRFLQLSPFSP